MAQEEKELLLKDLGARLSYGVKVTTTNPAAELGILTGVSIKGKISVGTKDADIVFECTEVKPYLRPMSSMTEEEKKEHFGRTMTIDIVQTSKEAIDWLNAHHFDYRGLIPMGLAIKVTEENNPYKR